ncbi:hypothetical protein HDU67_002388, partial [Dinochytrium kinnereticum]
DATKQDNRKDVYTEFQNSKKNPRDEVRAERKRREAEILRMRQEAEEEGLDYERVRAMSYSVQDVERYEKKERGKAKRADTGFTDYAQVAAKKYRKLVDGIKPNFAQYDEQKREAQALGVRLGGGVVGGGSESAAGGGGEVVRRVADGFYRDANSLAYAAQVQPSRKAVERLVKVVEKDAEKRKTFSRRRRHNEDDDVTYINERNMRFNKKIARAYDKHTAEIRLALTLCIVSPSQAAFERGTAL